MPNQPGAVSAANWQTYFDGDHAEDWIHREQSAFYVENLAASVRLTPDLRVLDFGCGCGFASALLSKRVGEIWFWDASLRMRQRAAAHADGANCHLLDTAEIVDQPEIAYALILVNSVAQYMSRSEFIGRLEQWRRWVTPSGSVVISDLLRPNAGRLSDAVDHVAFSSRNGVLFRAVRQLGREAATVGRRPPNAPMTRYSPDEIVQLAKAAGFSARILPRNLTHFTKRFTVALEPVSG